MPQLNFHDFAPQLVWLAITFVVLYLVMSKLAVPLISDTLDKRQAKIQGDLDAAEKASEDTRALVAAYEKRLADAREEARRLQRERNEADSAAATARLTELGDRLNGTDRRGREAHRRATRPGAWKASKTWRTTSPPTSTASSPASRPTAARCGPRSPPPKEATDVRHRMGRRQGRARRCRGQGRRLLPRSGQPGSPSPSSCSSSCWARSCGPRSPSCSTSVPRPSPRSLADAERLRAEAIAAKTAAEKTLAQATAEAEGIIAQARDEVARMQARAATSLQNAIALREQQALDRIAQSEAAASKQVRDTAVDVALGATRALAARAGRLGQVAGPGRPGDHGPAAPPSLIFEIPDRPHKTNRGLPMTPVARRGFFFAIRSRPHGPTR